MMMTMMVTGDEDNYNDNVDGTIGDKVDDHGDDDDDDDGDNDDNGNSDGDGDDEDDGTTTTTMAR